MNRAARLIPEKLECPPVCRVPFKGNIVGDIAMSVKWTKTSHGYHVRNKGGKVLYAHRLIAEKVLGRKLVGREQIHHADGDKTNNKNTNLVVCPSDEYHQLLHVRTKALDASGHADWRRCCYCLEYDAPANLRIYKTSPPRHGECNKAYFKQWHEKKQLLREMS